MFSVNTYLESKVQPFFASLPAWKLFVTLFVLPVFLAILAHNLVYAYSTVLSLAISFVFLCLVNILFISWVWAIGREANICLSVLGLEIKFHDIELIYRFIVISIFVVTIYFVVVMIWDISDEIDSFFVQMLGLIIGVLNAVATIGIYYIALKVSKIIVTLEFREKAYLIDYVGTFVLFLFFPVGVWFIQPKVLKLCGYFK